MTARRWFQLAFAGAALVVIALVVRTPDLAAAGGLPSPEQFIGFRVGTDNKLARWDKIVDYMKLAGAGSDRVRVRELGKTGGGNPMIALEIAAADTIKNLDRYKQLQRRLYFQSGQPSARERDDIFRQGKAVVLVTCSTHANEIGATQMALELVHQLATDDSPATKKVLDNVIVLLVPSLNPDGQMLVTDWFNRNVGTPYESSPMPFLSHPYVGHDSNRDMYMLTQKESQYTAQLAWHDWFPTVWLDEHQMGAGGPRIFVMPATDPINPNVHPVIYRWATIFGQSQAAALEAAGKDGIIYNSTYTNFWEGAMAWTGWWHNQIGLLTEVASVRIAGPIEQQRATPRDVVASERSTRDGSDPVFNATPLPPPVDTVVRTEYPRPWMGGRWTLRDIVDYELISTMALLETAADRRETILRQIYEINRQTIEEGRSGPLKAIVIPADQHDPREAVHLVERLMAGGVEIYRAEAPVTAGDDTFAAGSFLIPMTQVFARYAKDLLEKQTYPEVRRSPDAPAEPPYDVTAWSLGMLFGVDVEFVNAPLSNPRMTRVQPTVPRPAGRVAGNGPRYVFEYHGADTAIAMNRLIKDGARLAFQAPSRVVVDGAGRDGIDAVAREFGLTVASTERPAPGTPDAIQPIRLPRVALYSPWTGGNMDEGWTRWVLEQYEFPYTTIHNKDVRDGNLRQRFDTLILADQTPREMIDGYLANTVRPEYRGGIGDSGLDQISRFVADGGTLITLGAASDLAVDRFPIPIHNLKRGLRREQHFAPGTILKIQVDATQPMGSGMAPETYGFYNNSPFFSILEGFNALKPTVIARYPNQDVVASGWLRGEELMAGRAAVVSFDLKPAGRLVLFGLRPQHRAQTHATFPLLFNALYLPPQGGGQAAE